MVKLAVVTMTYNEADFLPLWLRHYTRAIGPRNCFVIDHGSTDGSTSDLWGAGYIPLPRSKYDVVQVSAFVSTFCSNLLLHFDWVLYVDIDELVVVDPVIYGSLYDLCERTTQKVVRSIGLNLHEVPGDTPLDPNKPATLQRKYVRFGYSMCKPLLTSVPIKWTPGNHSADPGGGFDHLFMFHLAPCDYQLNMRKLARTRVMPWGEGPAGAHQRVTDQERLNLLDTIGKLPKRQGMTFDDADTVLSERLALIDRFVSENAAERHKFYVKLQETNPVNELWEIPARFRGLV